MENTQLLGNSVHERLNTGTTVREFLRAAITALPMMKLWGRLASCIVYPQIARAGE